MPRSKRHTERYARQIDTPGWGAEGQKRLGASHVFVAGIGGLGCAAATYLAAAGVGKLTICDCDLLELSNLNRQVLYSTVDVGSPKAPLAAARLRALNPDIEIIPDLTEIDHANAAGLIGDATVVVDCLDNLETRVALNRAAIATRVPMVYAACSELTGHLSFLRPPDTPCLECFVSRLPPAVEPAIPGVTPATMGSLQAMEVVKYLTGIGEPLAGRLLILEGTEPRIDVIQIERDPDCPACRGLS